MYVLCQNFWTILFSESYFDLIKKCLDEDLVWILSRTFPEENKETNDSRFSGYHPPLPIPISQSLVVLIGEGDKGKQVAVRDNIVF